MSESVDLLIVGGGINGAGIARDAAGRGLSVLLAEKADLASATSAASSKLIHGGLRYLEHYEFRLVRESLNEREVLLRAAPHIIWPLRFVLPHHKGLRPAFVLRTGLFIYDHLGGRKQLPATRTIRLGRDPAGQPLKPEFTLGFEYSDCWVEDSRLVALNAMDAAARGAVILTRTKVTSARREDGHWLATLEGEDGTERAVRAKALVNAAGPWVMDTQRAIGRRSNSQGVRLVKGSHIVVRKLYDGPQCYTLQNADNRIVFAIPYERDFTLIGTTDIPFEGEPADVACGPDEVSYLCRLASEYFRTPIDPSQVVWTYSGVRPLYDDGTANVSAITRDYTLDLDAPAPDSPGGGAPSLSVFGGKITTYRKLAEDALLRLLPAMGRSAAPWTATVPLPGGDIEDADFDRFLTDLGRRFPWAPAEALRRLARAYGTRVEAILGKATRWQDLGRDFGAGLTEAELDYLRAEEWARTADDVLWRRSKLGLHLDAGQRDAVRAAMGA
ncbi:MAG TPA: glycerol-3-phosphate dehydrogenase [Azospirillaceae bacterium]|nr:glycerol-3-phosphate dehydrogenase [Azospirillaceae bacterium]